MISTIFKIESAELLMLLHDASDRILWVVARVAFVSILFLVTISCDRPTDEVSVDFTNGTDYADTLSITQYDGFHQDTLVVSFVAKGQTARVKFRIVKQSFATLGFAGNQNIILLKPGADLEIKVQDDATFSFSGDNELINTYLCAISPLIDRTEGTEEMPLGDFFSRFDSVKVIFESFSAEFNNTHQAGDEEKDLIGRINNSELARMGSTRLYSYHNDTLVKQIMAYMETGQLSEFSIPARLLSFDERPPVDSLLMALSYPHYYNYVYYYLSHISARDFDVATWDGPRLYWPLRVDSVIERSNVPLNICEYMKAKNIHEWLSEQGKTAELDTLFQSFKTEFNSIYTSELQRSFERYASIATGAIAPDISGVTPDGQVKSLSSFEGQVVFVDLWATWCGPCVREVPFAIELQRQLKGRSLVFLNISIDRKSEDWLRYLESHPTWAGVHLRITRQEEDSFRKNYGIHGVPVYMIIDQQGKIVSTHAPRPSKPELKNLLLSLVE